MIFPPESPPVASIAAAASELAVSMAGASAATAVAAHEAMTAVWGCTTLGIACPEELARRASDAPFSMRVGAVRRTLDGLASGGDGASGGAASAAVAALASELPLVRETIASGSAVPSSQHVVEDRGTCWLSDTGLDFAYSGKTMSGDRRLTPGVAAIRDAVHESVGEAYCSVLLNHYPDGGSGMRFHADPGQGPEGGWGYSTCVVSVGETRTFIFRRADDPSVRCSFAVRHGDVLHMHRDCQMAWQHSVAREAPGGTVKGTTTIGGSSRISLVFKRPLAFERARGGDATPEGGSATDDSATDGDSATNGDRAMPVAYTSVTRELRVAAASGKWPPTGAARARVLVGCGLGGIEDGAILTLSNPHQITREGGASRGGARARRRVRPARTNALFPNLVRAVFALEKAIAPSGWHPNSGMCAIGINAQLTPHTLPPTRDGDGTLLVALGEEGRGSTSFALGEEDGAVAAQRGVVGLPYQPTVLPDDGTTLWTATEKPEGRAEHTFWLMYFTPPLRDATSEATAAARLSARLEPPLLYRERSTDELVITELLGRQPAYQGPPVGDPRWDWGRFGRDAFSPRGHVVLDVGAQIGVFTRLALDAGCKRVVAIEPEDDNVALWQRNCGEAVAAGRAQLIVAAAVHGAPSSGGTAQLVVAPPRSDGVVNTWRHALDGLSHYKAPPSAGSQQSTPENSCGGGGGGRLQEVKTLPLFGQGGLLDVHSPSFVKLDCEGAELELLASAPSGQWQGVTRLVFEWSFTKAEAAGLGYDAFSRVVSGLEAEGFAVWYEGRGNWDKCFSGASGAAGWPWHSDAIAFAARELKTS